MKCSMRGEGIDGWWLCRPDWPVNVYEVQHGGQRALMNGGYVDLTGQSTCMKCSMGGAKGIDGRLLCRPDWPVNVHEVQYGGAKGIDGR